MPVKSAGVPSVHIGHNSSKSLTWGSPGFRSRSMLVELGPDPTDSASAFCYILIERVAFEPSSPVSARTTVRKHGICGAKLLPGMLRAGVGGLRRWNPGRWLANVPI